MAGILDPLMLRAAGAQATNLLPSLAKLRFGAGLGKSALIGAGIGGIAGLARGDNYSSTAALRNFTSGALGGAAVGMGARTILSRKGLNAARHLAVNTVPTLAGTGVRLASNAANAGMKTGGFLARNPGIAFAGAAVVGGAMYMSGPSGQDFSDAQFGEEQDNNSVTSRSFQNSAAGLVQGLHRSRHRGG